MNLSKLINQYHKNIRTDQKAKDYLKSRGFIYVDTMIKNYKLGCCRSKNDYFYGYIVFPIILDNQIISATGRAYLPNIEPKHKHWPGKIRAFYNHDSIYQDRELFITESPLDTLSLDHAGFMSSIASLGGRIPELIDDLRNKKIYLIYDNDINKSGLKHARRLAKRIHRNKNEIRIITIPLPENKEKIDVNDLLIKFGDIRFTNCIRRLCKKSESYDINIELIKDKLRIKSYDNEDSFKYDLLYIVRDHDIQVNRFKAYCPFHPDHKTPSFVIYPVSQSFYCFGCSTGGDVYTFIQKLLGMNFKEAKEYLKINYE